jgi:hypothetical protein
MPPRRYEGDERTRDAASRLDRVRAVRAVVDDIRGRTVCARCGAQPIDWHNDGHVGDPLRRIAWMVNRARALAAILAEIASCEPLCRGCHMRADGRLARLIENRPRKAGDVVTEPRPCAECGRLYKPLRMGLCAACDARRRRATTATRRETR